MCVGAKCSGTFSAKAPLQPGLYYIALLSYKPTKGYSETATRLLVQVTLSGGAPPPPSPIATAAYVTPTDTVLIFEYCTSTVVPAIQHAEDTSS